MFRKFGFILIFISIILLTQINFCKAEVIDDLSSLQPVFELSKKYLSEKLNMKLNKDIKVNLASAELLDMLYQGEFKGAELGFYQFGGGVHDIYILKGLSRDRCLGTLAHELTHAWQQENCPQNQSLELKEGFATWVEIKVLQADGANSLALDIMGGCQGVYWQGLKLLMDIEDKSGEKAVFDYVKTH